MYLIESTSVISLLKNFSSNFIFYFFYECFQACRMSLTYLSGINTILSARRRKIKGNHE